MPNDQGVPNTDSRAYWTTLLQEVVFEASPWVTLLRERVELPSGRILDDFYRLKLPDFVSIVPVTPAGQIVMVRGYKHGLRKENLSPPAGMIDPGEKPLITAQRELLEETGYIASDWKRLGSFVVDGNRECGTMHLYLATGAVRTQDAMQDDAEELRVEIMSCDQIIKAIASGEIGNLAGACAVAAGILLGVNARSD